MKTQNILYTSSYLVGIFCAIYLCAFLGIEPPGTRLFASRAPDKAQKIIYELRFPSHQVSCMVRKP